MLRNNKIVSLEKKIKEHNTKQKMKRGSKKLFSQVSSFIALMDKNTKAIEHNEKKEPGTKKKYYLQRNNCLNLNMKASLKFKKRKNLIADFCDNTETPSRKKFTKKKPEASKQNIKAGAVRSRSSLKAPEAGGHGRSNSMLRKPSRKRNNSTTVKTGARKRISALVGNKKHSMPFYQKCGPFDLSGITRFRTMSPSKMSPSRLNGPSSYSRRRLEKRRGNILEVKLNQFQKTKRRVIGTQNSFQKSSPRISNNSVSSSKGNVKGMLRKKMVQGRSPAFLRRFRRSVGRGPVKVQLFTNLEVRDVFF